ncbi:hypothetical protein EV702DRAFT_1046799 [Suillus placidus]|uniref:Uncharacterized protein n=1 Tax=Suillus placidus TaxID=48579 RepID=A0A9P6ZSI6_9AGAM|nr:hypothetical protein EV702DRAFT_1046799 [Suillus placidus]
MSSDSESVDSRPSDFNDAAEFLLIDAAGSVKANERDQFISSRSHDYVNCLGQIGYGQGAPVYPCGCYKHMVDSPERLKRNWNAAMSKDFGSILKRKRSWSDDEDTVPRRAASQPILEGQPRHQKTHKRLKKAFEFKGATQAETLMEVGRVIEAAINRQTAILSEICEVLKSHGVES